MEFEAIATGFCLLEAPRADERGVWFSEIVEGGIRCLRPDGRIDAWLTSRRPVGGIVFNEDGAVLCSGPDGIVCVNPDTGASGAVLQEIEGVPLRGVNDVSPDGRGGLLFGTVDHVAMLRGEDFYGRSALCHLDASGRVTRVSDGHHFANGIGISPDGQHVYFNDSSVGTYIFQRSADGDFAKVALFDEIADCDGLAVDSEGAIWVAAITSGAIVRVNARGKILERIPVPGGHVTSLCFGGADLHDMFLTTAAPDAGQALLRGEMPAARTATLYHARAEIPGFPLPPTRFHLTY
jgi:sugar lactone lactonase YvrE